MIKVTLNVASEINLVIILPKDPLARRLEQPGINPATFQLVHDVLLSYSHLIWIQSSIYILLKLNYVLSFIILLLPFYVL